MIDTETLNSVIDEEIQRMNLEGETGRKIISLAQRLKRKLRDRTFESVSELFDLCDEIDGDRSLKVEVSLKNVIVAARRRALVTLVTRHFDAEAKDIPYLGVEQSRQLRAEQRIAEVLTSILAEIKAMLLSEQRETFDQHWLKMRFTDQMSIIEDALRYGQTGIADWSGLKCMMPATLSDRFQPDARDTEGNAFVEQLKGYKKIAEHLGPEVVAQLLVSSGIVKQGGFEGAMRLITPYLGRCATKEPNFIDVTGFPETLLKFEDLRELLFLKLRNSVYRQLSEREEAIAQAEGDVTKEMYLAWIGSIKKEAEQLLRTQFGTRRTADAQMQTHQELCRELFDRVLGYFEEAVSLDVPPRIVSSGLVVNGKNHMFPALRQRIAMKEMADKRRQIIAFFMAKGKTESAFLAKEHVGAKKMLFVCIPGMQQKIAARINGDFSDGQDRDPCYREGKQPSVGIIEAGMKPDQFGKALEAEVVIVPYSMLNQKMNGLTVAQCLQQYKDESGSTFDFLAADEVHNARKEGKAYTDALYGLVGGIPGLYDKGYIALLSGEPVPNRPQDIVPQLRIMDRETYGNAPSVRTTVNRTHPLVIRNALLRYLLVLDKPEDWERFIKHIDYPLEHPEERALYEAIVEDDRFTANQKIHLLSLCLLNPSLLAAGSEIGSSLFDKLTQQLDAYLEGNNSVVIAENARKVGVSREGGVKRLDETEEASETDEEQESDEDPRRCVYLCHKLRQYLKEQHGNDVELCIIDGDTPAEDRERIIEQARASSKGSGKKTVIFAMRGCIGEGINLNHIRRAIVLEPTFNKPDLAQFVMRFAREGVTDAEIAVLCARDTVHEGIAANADMKYNVVQAMKHGGTFTSNDLALFDIDYAAKTIMDAQTQIELQSPIIRYVDSRKEKLNKMFGYLRGKGTTTCAEFFAQHGQEFARLYTEDWDTSHSANNGRFVAGLVRQMEEQGVIKGSSYADVASGPLVMEMTLGCADAQRQRKIVSVDLNGYMLEYGMQMVAARRQDPSYVPRCVVGSMSSLREASPEHFGNKSLSLLNCSIALHYTKLGSVNRKRNKLEDERVRTLYEFNSALKPDGILLLTMPDRSCSEEELRRLCTEALPAMGFEVLEEYTGRGTSLDEDTQGHRFTNITIVCRKVHDTDVRALENLDLSALKLTRQTSYSTRGPRWKKDNGGGVLREGFRHTQFAIQENAFSFDVDDRKLKEQQKKIGRINSSVNYLRRIYKENGNSFESLGAEVMHELEERNITLCFFESQGRMLHLFMLPEDPGHLRNPLDEETWGPLDVTE